MPQLAYSVSYFTWTVSSSEDEMEEETETITITLGRMKLRRTSKERNETSNRDRTA